MTVSGNHHETAVGEHAQATGDTLGEHRHILDAPGLVAGAEHLRAQLKDQVTYAQPGQFGPCGTAAISRSPRRARAARSRSAGAGPLAGTSWTTQPITRAVSPDW